MPWSPCSTRWTSSIAWRRRTFSAASTGRPPPDFAGAIPHKAIELDNLVVRGGLRSQGIGRQLLDAIVDWSRGQGFAPSIDRLVLAM